MKAYQLLLATTALVIASSAASAQVPGYRVPPRTEDHFQRDLVLSRIDLTEKINQPLVSSMSLELYTPGASTEYRGVVAALINGLKTGKYLAHDPDGAQGTSSGLNCVNYGPRLLWPSCQPLRLARSVPGLLGA